LRGFEAFRKTGMNENFLFPVDVNFLYANGVKADACSLSGEAKEFEENAWYLNIQFVCIPHNNGPQL